MAIIMFVYIIVIVANVFIPSVDPMIISALLIGVPLLGTAIQLGEIKDEIDEIKDEISKLKGANMFDAFIEWIKNANADDLK